jgi:hypothetical protein
MRSEGQLHSHEQEKIFCLTLSKYYFGSVGQNDLTGHTQLSPRAAEHLRKFREAEIVR